MGNYDIAKNSLIRAGLKTTHISRARHMLKKTNKTKTKPEKTLYFHLGLILRVKENRK